MLADDLFNKVLIEPFDPDATLFIVSGYASAAMASRHFSELIADGRKRSGFIRNKSVRVNLIVGMAGRDGVSKHDHQGFQELVQAYDGMFACRYVIYGPPVHCKAFAWHDGDNAPITGFVGSANYTQSAFSPSRREVMVEHDAQAIRSYYRLVMQDTIDCMDPNVATRVDLYDGRRDEAELEKGASATLEDKANLQRETVSFLDNKGELPRRSGLNWGQRLKREPNQAYIRVPVEIRRSNFFPNRGEHFTIITDDDKTLICVIAQDDGKAIHTPLGNSQMGIYFRYRLGVAGGAKVERADLERYGRMDVDFYKIDDETYYMDFSV